MQNLPEGLIYILVLAVAYLANYFLKRFAPQMEPQPPQAEPEDGSTTAGPAPVGLAAASIAEATPLPGPQLAVAGSMLPVKPRGQLTRLTLLGSKRNKQTAIAMATILGPCRAFESHAGPASAGR